MFFFLCLILFLSLVLPYVFRSSTLKGYLGERAVAGHLKKLDRNKYTVLNDLLVPSMDGKTTQIDHVVVSPFGVFVIETKNWQGLIIGAEDIPQWKQHFGKQSKSVGNPIWQNTKHAKALKVLLPGEMGDVPFHSILAFSSKAKLNIQAQTEVVYYSQLLHAIKKQSYPVLTMQQVQQIAQRFQAANNPGRDARKKHVAVIRSDQKARKQQLSAGICPRCGSKLVQRSGKYGPFLGCSGYPKCRFISKEAN